MCGELKVITKPIRWNKPDTQTPRHGSWAVFDALKSFIGQNPGIIIEYTSSDGFFVKITGEVNRRMAKQRKNPIVVAQNCFLEQGNPPNSKRTFLETSVGQDVFRLLCGSVYLFEMATFLLEETSIECSVGVSSNKLLAKLACQLNKPRGITVLPYPDFEAVLERRDIDLSELPGFGKSVGDWVSCTLRFRSLRQVRQLEQDELEALFGLSYAQKLFDGSRGFCNEEVTTKDVNKNMACGKSFQGSEKEMSDGDIVVHINNLGGEMNERLLEEQTRHQRTTETLQLKVVYYNLDQTQAKRTKSFSISSEWNEIPALALKAFRSFRINLQVVRINKISIQVTTWKTEEVVSEDSQTQRSIGFISVTQPGYVYQLKISLEETEPKIWRTIQVPEDFTFYELHHAIQNAIGWDDSTFHEFELGLGVRDESGQKCMLCVGMPNKLFSGIKVILNDKVTPIKMFLEHIEDQVTYQHGFTASLATDDWPHTVVLEQVLVADPSKAYPRCIAGERACPPEFDMEPFAFTELLEQLEDPEEAKELHDEGYYVGYDPNKFNPEDVFFSEVEVSSDGEEE